MNRVIFDIETMAFPFESLDSQQQEYLMKFAKTEEEKAEVLLKLNLNPFTAQIIAVGMLNPESNRGKVFYQGPGEELSQSEDGLIDLVPCTEKELLEEFWTSLTHYAQFITFNGRSFDCPFLMLRSAMLGVKPTRNLLPYRYGTQEHCDLMEQFTFYGAFRKFSLDFYCKAFTIKSPKGGGLTGLDLGSLFHEGKYREIAEYCLGDVRATGELFQRWLTFLAFEK
jgi:3'-5' exonuclease